MSKIRLTLAMIAIFLLIQLPTASSAVDIGEGPIQIEAERIQYITDPESYEAEGDVVILFEGGFLKADRVVYKVETGKAEAEGNVFIQSGNDTLEGHSAILDTVTGQGVVTQGKAFFEENHFFIRGKRLERRGDQDYSFHDAEMTSCCGDVPDWKITGKKIDVTVDGYGTIEHGTFQVRDFPLIYVPWMVFPAKTTRQSGFLQPRLAYSEEKLGWDIDIPYFWAISESTDATFYQRYLSKRGFQEGVEFRYYLTENSFGTIYADYLRDDLDVTTEPGDGELFRDWKEPRNRWSWYVDHESRFESGLAIRANLKKVSDNWYFKDFDSYNYFIEHYDEDEDKPFSRVDFVGDAYLPYLDSTVRITQDWERFNLTMLGQYRDNLRTHSNERTLQKYPEIILTGWKQPIGDTPFDFDLDSTYGYYYRSLGQRGHYFDFAPTVSLPLNAGRYFRFIPEAGIRDTRWDSTDTSGSTDDSRDNRTVYHLGSTLSTEFERIFPMNWGSLDKLRHSIRPEIQYLYRPYASQDNRPDYVEFLDEENSITYSLTNILTARFIDEEGKRSYRELVDLKISQTYDIIEARRGKPPTATDQKKRPFSDVDFELTLSPHSFVRFTSDATLGVYDGDWKKLNGLLRVRDGRGDSAGVEYRYTRDLLEQVNFDMRVKVTDRLDLTYQKDYDRLEGENLETIYGLLYKKQCWDIAFTYTDSPDDRTYLLIISLSGLGRLVGVSGTFPGSD